MVLTCAAVILLTLMVLVIVPFAVAAIFREKLHMRKMRKIYSCTRGI